MKTQENMKRLLNGIPRADLAWKPVHENCAPELTGFGEERRQRSAIPATFGYLGRDWGWAHQPG